LFGATAAAPSFGAGTFGAAGGTGFGANASTAGVSFQHLTNTVLKYKRSMPL